MPPDDRFQHRYPNDTSFHTTRWSVVLAARGANREEVALSLEALCRQYWSPLYSFVRNRGHREHDAQDLTQAFFVQLLEKDWLTAANPARGRFRSFLLMALKRFLANAHDYRTAQKRGGDVKIFPLDMNAESVLADPKGRSPETLFDRQWAMTVLETVMGRLRQDYQDAGRLDDYERLKSSLTAERGTIDYERLAAQLGVRPVSARSSVHRMRARFRDLFREEVAGTVADPTEIEDEVRALLAALGTS